MALPAVVAMPASSNSSNAAARPAEAEAPLTHKAPMRSRSPDVSELAALHHSSRQPGAPCQTAASTSQPAKPGAGRAVIVQARIDTGARRPGPAEAAEALLGELLKVLRSDWRSIRSSNLGAPACLDGCMGAACMHMCARHCKHTVLCAPQSGRPGAGRTFACACP